MPRLAAPCSSLICTMLKFIFRRGAGAPPWLALLCSSRDCARREAIGQLLLSHHTHTKAGSRVNTAQSEEFKSREFK